MENRYGDEEFAELVKVVEASKNGDAITLLKFLLNPDDFDILKVDFGDVEFEELTNTVLSSGAEEAIVALYSLMTEKHHEGEIVRILSAVVESRISSEKGKFAKLSEKIQQAINVAYDVASDDMFDER